MDQFSNIEANLNVGAMSIQDATEKLEQFKQVLKDLYKYEDFNFVIRVNDDGSYKIVEKTTAAINDLAKAQEKSSKLWDEWATKVDAVGSSFNSLGSAMNSIAGALGEDNEEMQYNLQLIGETISTIGDLIGQYVTAAMQIQQFVAMKQMEILTTNQSAAAKTAEAAAQTASNTAQIAGTTATAADTAVTNANTGAKTALSMANIIASLSQAPWFMVLPLVLAGVATVAGLIASFVKPKQFADGGIVGGNSFYKDGIPAMLSSGEMVINRKDQARLWGFIKGAREDRVGGMGGNVTFTIRGEQLQGVLSNYNKKQSKIR